MSTLTVHFGKTLGVGRRVVKVVFWVQVFRSEKQQIIQYLVEYEIVLYYVKYELKMYFNEATWKVLLTFTRQLVEERDGQIWRWIIAHIKATKAWFSSSTPSWSEKVQLMKVEIF